MPAIFLGLASAESKLSCRMLSPDEFNVIANTQKQVAQCEIQEAMVFFTHSPKMPICFVYLSVHMTYYGRPWNRGYTSPSHPRRTASTPGTPSTRPQFWGFCVNKLFGSVLHPLQRVNLPRTLTWGLGSAGCRMADARGMVHSGSETRSHHPVATHTLFSRGLVGWRRREP